MDHISLPVFISITYSFAIVSATIKKSLLLATNQGLIFVLAVVVIGGFVGSGGLGYLVIVGGSKPELQGKGLVAGFSILLLGVMIDRIAHASARKYGN